MRGDDAFDPAGPSDPAELVRLEFPHRYRIEALARLPGAPDIEEVRYFPPDLAGGRDGVLIRVWPAETRRWCGMFAPAGFTAGFDGIYSAPFVDEFCVVSGGAGYAVRADDPSRWRTISAFPIQDVRAAPDAGLLLFIDDARIVAWGSEGEKWVTRRLSLDGIRIEEVAKTHVRGTAFDPTGPPVEFRVDLASGEHEGGLDSGS